MPAASSRSISVDQYGRDVANFEIGEPLGTVSERSRADESGIGWWGSLDEVPPIHPV
jgi:hypothetical protein